MITDLTDDARRLLSAIVMQVRDGKLKPGLPETYIGYKEAHSLMGIEMNGPRWDVSLKNQGLVDLATWTVDREVPKVTGLIVNQRDFKPGAGYFHLFGRSEDDLDWWHRQARESIGFDWSEFIPEQEIPTREELEIDERSIVEGTRSRVDTHIRERCELLKRRAKGFHRDMDGLLRCKACRWHNPAPASFIGDIVEMHHIEPLRTSPESGRKWNLSDAVKNLIPLCPTCHRLIHALPNGLMYSLEDLIYLLRKYSQEDASGNADKPRARARRSKKYIDV